MKPQRCIMGSYLRLDGGYGRGLRPRYDEASHKYECPWCGRMLNANNNLQAMAHVLPKHNKPQTLAQTLTKRQRKFLRMLAEDKSAATPGGYCAPCPRIGDLKILQGLCKRMLVKIADQETGYVPSCWVRYMKITDAGLEVVRELDEARAEREAAKAKETSGEG